MYRWLVTQPDLNSHKTLHGGILMKWIDESAGMEARLITGKSCVTRYISNIDFVATAKCGDIIEVCIKPYAIGNTSITFSATVKNKMAGLIAVVDRIVFVAVDEDGIPTSIK